VLITRGVDKITWLPPSDREAARVLATTFQCLFEVTEVADIYLKLGFSAQLANVRDAFVSSLTVPIGEGSMSTDLQVVEKRERSVTAC